MTEAEDGKAESSVPSNPVACLVPYLPLSTPLVFSGWWLGPLESFGGPWLSTEFEQSVRRLAEVFRDPAGQPLRRPSILVSEVDGADGAPPSREALRCLQLAIAFATIQQNVYWSSDDRHDGWRVATSDNAMLWVQPLDLVDHRIALGRGSRVQSTAGGYKLTDEGFLIPPPLELHLPFYITLDAELLEALYTVLMQPPAGTEHVVSSIAVAVSWLIKSWQNTPSITWEDRLVFVKVATEALTGKERSHESAAALLEIFRSTPDQRGAGVGGSCLLWQPDEPLLTRTYTKNGRPTASEVTQMEHWACALGDARNAVVHGEADIEHMYHEANSPYAGPFVEIGDRVVREAITVILGALGYPRVWRRGIARASFAAYEHLLEVNSSESAAEPG